ncbi:hypothetical protein KZX37_14445 [Microbacterium sp. EYE_5]|uniref:hypothetical protein n=1 Tax=unclassified Microbacterium TaxID=2609290 RepID=UPI002004BF25|nr:MULTISPECIES: hypothetical protein [unclassified Microbacterium]MCK6081812.1 hypothetical protein [Microbacterium sp. EYE_382]MCK6087082.1 hypothetical protein [Microbacterium sp. EYE_384]MCK6124940.1 hypothetical protein [Microbacterium sp. EYE_80]MCK6127845.1 hypothetical protein [Microbacterium sp. EYE_79]MCK6142766.1 hypothetical protein [Microbacterium sp. EYE_39]
MPSGPRFRAAVRIDLDLACAHPDDLIAGTDDAARMSAAAIDAEDVLLSLIDVRVARGADHLVQIESSTTAVVDSEWEGTTGSVPSGSSDTARVARTGARLAGIDWALDELFGTASGGTEEAAALRQRTVIKGLVWNASVVVVDCLFEDVRHLADRPDDRSAWRDTHVISQLPSQYATHYDRAFAQKFLAATIEVTSRLSASPVYPPTVAHELALKIVLDEAQRGADRLAGALPQGWREHLDTVLFQDLDVESLFAEQDARTKQDAANATPPLDFASWFIPYAHAPAPAPYANDDIKEPSRR